MGDLQSVRGDDLSELLKTLNKTDLPAELVTVEDSRDEVKGHTLVAMVTAVNTAVLIVPV